MLYLCVIESWCWLRGDTTACSKLPHKLHIKAILTTRESLEALYLMQSKRNSDDGDTRATMASSDGKQHTMQAAQLCEVRVFAHDSHIHSKQSG